MSSKIFNIVLYILLGISAILGVYYFVATDFKELSNAYATSSTLIYWCYALLIIASLLSIIYPLMYMVQNPKNAKNALIGIVGLVVVFIMGYLLASGEEIYDAKAILIADETTSKLSEAGLNAFYILGLGAIGVIIFSEVSKIFK